MRATIWDLKKGQRFRTNEGMSYTVVTPKEDAKGFVDNYLEGALIGQQDFVFEEEIDFDSITRQPD